MENLGPILAELFCRVHSGCRGLQANPPQSRPKRDKSGLKTTSWVTDNLVHKLREYAREAAPSATMLPFRDLLLDGGRRRVRRGPTTIRMGRLSYDMLYVLVGAAPSVITQDEFARGVWAGRLVTPDTVTQRVGN